MKKLISAALSAVMLTGALPASAVDTDIRKAVDFSVTTENTDSTIAGDINIPDGFVDMHYGDAASANGTKRVFYYAPTQIYGKSAEDKCLRINKIWAELWKVDNASQKWFQLRYNSELTGGNYYHISTELAFVKDNNSPEILMWCDDMRICNMVYDTTSHTYNLLVGGESKATVSPETWVDFDIVIDAAEQTADLYIDENAVATDIVLANKITGQQRIGRHIC